MVKVFVTGGNGYIGKATALALRRAGHEVTALVRNKEQGLALLKEEVKFVVGALEAKLDEKVFGPVLEHNEVVIDTTLPGGGNPFAINGALRDAVVAAAKKSGRRKRYVYCSGVLVYGDYPNQVVSEDMPCKTKFLQGRVAFEQETVGHKDIDGVVVRPGYVYGGTNGSFLQYYFATNAKGEIEIAGKPEKQWGWVHIDDVANAFLLTAEGPRALVAGEIFDVADGTRITFQQMREAFVKQAGIAGAKVVSIPLPDPKVDWFAHAADVSCVVSAEKIRRVLGWKPKHGPLLDELPLYWEAMQANKKPAA